VELMLDLDGWSFTLRERYSRPKHSTAAIYEAVVHAQPFGMRRTNPVGRSAGDQKSPI
jgi:hypothetical protein